MEMQFPRELIVRREVYAIQLFGRSLLERIPPERCHSCGLPFHAQTHDRSRLARAAVRRF